MKYIDIIEYNSVGYNEICWIYWDASDIMRYIGYNEIH